VRREGTQDSHGTAQPQTRGKEKTQEETQEETQEKAPEIALH
jgi:hypothetical protein